MTEWISVKERLPTWSDGVRKKSLDCDMDYITIIAYYPQTEFEYEEVRTVTHFVGRYDKLIRKFTYWMPLPPIPEEISGEEESDTAD